MAMAARRIVRLGQGLSFLSVASASAYLAASSSTSASHAHEDAASRPKPPLAKVVYEEEIVTSASKIASLTDWLSAHCAEVLKRPGFLGAKLHRCSEPSKPLVIFVLGGPGAGKGTQCGRIVDDFSYEHLSAGDLLRAARKSGSEQGQLIDEYIKEGKIVPVEITVALLKQAMEASGKSRFLIDGFPRNGNNLGGWQQQMSEHCHVGGVLMFECAEEVMEARLLERGKSSGRADDNAASIKKRFATYSQETLPVLQYYEQLGLVHRLDGAKSVGSVYKSVCRALEAVHAADAQRRAQLRCVVHFFVRSRAELDAYLGSEQHAQARSALAAAFPASAEGGVRTRVLEPEGSLHPYGLSSARAFD